VGLLQQAERLAHPNEGDLQIDPELLQDTRSVRQKITSARFSGIVQVGERAVLKTMTRISEWRKVIQEAERKKLRRSVLDMCVFTMISFIGPLIKEIGYRKEERRQIERLHDWSIPFHSEHGLWPMNQGEQMWRLDETEGPNRIRFAPPIAKGITDADMITQEKAGTCG
jgi:hypothetical protein